MPLCKHMRTRSDFTPSYLYLQAVGACFLLTTVYNCAQIKLTTPRYGGSLWEMLLSIPTGDGHDQEQDSEVRRIGAG